MLLFCVVVEFGTNSRYLPKLNVISARVARFAYSEICEAVEKTCQNDVKYAKFDLLRIGYLLLWRNVSVKRD